MIDIFTLEKNSVDVSFVNEKKIFSFHQNTQLTIYFL